MYILDYFETTKLPIAAPRHTAGTVPSQQRMIRTLGGGVYDAAGGEKAAALLPFELVYDCKAVGATAAELRSTLDQLRSLRGVEARLYRKAIDDGSRHWATARLMTVDYETEARHSHGLFQPLSMTFKITSLWHGTLHGPSWCLNSGKYLNTGLYLNMGDRYALTTPTQTLTITNGGQVAVDDVVLTLEAGATPVTGLTVTVGPCHLVFSGTVAATKSLVLNCSPRVMSVLNDGVGAWTDLILGPSHASEAWLRLAKGANSLIATRTGGGSDTYLTVAFSDLWE